MNGQYQIRWDADTGDIKPAQVVGTKAHERGPKEQQGDLLLWNEQQEDLSQWVADNAPAEREEM